MTRRSDYPVPRDFGGDGLRVARNRWALDANTNAERDFASARRAPHRPIHRRLLQDGERTYQAYSLDELLEIESQAHHGRPGLPY